MSLGHAFIYCSNSVYILFGQDNLRPLFGAGTHFKILNIQKNKFSEELCLLSTNTIDVNNSRHIFIFFSKICRVQIVHKAKFSQNMCHDFDQNWKVLFSNKLWIISQTASIFEQPICKQIILLECFGSHWIPPKFIQYTVFSSSHLYYHRIIFVRRWDWGDKRC